MKIIQRIKNWVNKPIEESKSGKSWEFALLGGSILVFIIGVFCGVEAYHSWRSTHEWQSPIVFRSFVRKIELPEPQVLSPISGEIEKETLIGLASYYSHDGCEGCSEGQIMANGEPFVESAITIAYNRLPLGTFVRVTNLVTQDSIVAEITDTGGFEELGRIADLSLGTKNAINCSDMCEVEISLVR